jgi:hypothetical protein
MTSFLGAAITKIEALLTRVKEKCYKSAVSFVDLVQQVPGLKDFVGLTDIEDETV